MINLSQVYQFGIFFGINLSNNGKRSNKKTDKFSLFFGYILTILCLKRQVVSFVGTVLKACLAPTKILIF